MSTANLRVVLVEPKDSLNIGSVARAMSNLGFSNLHLVCPHNYNREKALQTACWASDLIENAFFHEKLETAVADTEEVVGFTARTGCYRPAHLNLSDWIDSHYSSKNLKTAILFGPEDTGLTSEHIEVCRWLVRIPSTSKNPAFNLAQSVVIALWELGKQASNLERIPLSENMADLNDYFQLERMIKILGTTSGFIGAGTPGPVPAILNNIFKRTYLTKREMGILLGFFGKLERNSSTP